MPPQEQLGWTQAALAAAARDRGLSPSVAGLLGRGEVELVEVRSRVEGFGGRAAYTCLALNLTRGAAARPGCSPGLPQWRRPRNVFPTTIPTCPSTHLPRTAQHFVELCNRRLSEELAARSGELAELRVRDRLEAGMRARLQMLEPVIGAGYESPQAYCPQGRQCAMSQQGGCGDCVPLVSLLGLSQPKLLA